MLEMVEARKDADKVEEHYDLFSGLLDAAQDEPGCATALSDDELIGWYPHSGSLGILSEIRTFSLRKHVSFSFCWT
jgi:hypothetical protein